MFRGGFFIFVILAVTKVDSEGFTCSGKPDGLYADPNDCAKYHQCSGGVKYTTPCNSGLFFNPNTRSCDWPSHVNCNLVDTGPGFSCTNKNDGLHADPINCNTYHRCHNGVLLKTNMCYGDLLFNSKLHNCDWRQNVDCSSKRKPVVEYAPEIAPTAGAVTTTLPPTTTTTRKPTTTREPTTTMKITTEAQSLPTTTKVQPPPSTSTQTTTGPPQASSTGGQSQVFTCLHKASGIYPDHTDCTQYYQCQNGVQYDMACQEGLRFDVVKLRCDWPASVQCASEQNNAASEREQSPGETTTGASAPLTVLCEACKLPDCRCIGEDIPGQIAAARVPMMIILTFDDSVTELLYNRYFTKLLENGLKNPNGCPIKATFFVANEGGNTDFRIVKKLGENGHEMASHSKSHKTPSTYWKSASYEAQNIEIQGMRELIHSQANIALEDINGMRAPFLTLGGDNQFQVLQDNNFRYDSSIPLGGPTIKTKVAPKWPFTFDVVPDIPAVCSSQNCTKKSFPGLWELGMNVWYGANNYACAMVDACSMPRSVSGKVEIMKKNYHRHNITNKAPLNIFLHGSWFMREGGNFEALEIFLHYLTQQKDVWILTVNQVLDWVQHPVALPTVPPSWSCSRN